jgi:hypothetical protein
LKAVLNAAGLPLMLNETHIVLVMVGKHPPRTALLRPRPAGALKKLLHPTPLANPTDLREGERVAG